MIKKLLKQFIPAYFLFLGIFASCTSDVDPGSPIPASGISLRLQTTRSSVDTGTDLENQIHNIHFWFFASNASGTDKALFYTSELPTSIGSELVFSYTDEVLRLHNMNSQGKYKLLVVANLPADAMNAIGETTTQDELKNYFYSAAASGRPHNPFSMTGCTTGAHDFSIDSEVSISLLRIASRLDVKIVNATGKTLQVNKVSIINDQQSVQLFAPASGAAAPASNPFEAAADIYTTSITADKVECSGYVYENRSDTPTDVVIEGNVDGNAAKWTVPIKPDGSTTLPRNSICKATINLKGITPVDVTYSIEEWKNTLIDNSLDETYLELSSNSIKLNEVGEGEIYLSSNADSIKVDLGETPLVILGHSQNSKGYIKPLTTDVYHLQLAMSELSEQEYNGTISITAKNLVYQIPVKKSASISKFHYVLEKSYNTELPWYITSRMDGNLQLELDRNIPAHVIVQKTDIYTLEDGTEIKNTDSKVPYEIGYPPEYEPDIINIPLEINMDENRRIIYEIEVGILPSYYGITIAKYTYTIGAYDSSLLP